MWLQIDSNNINLDKVLSLNSKAISTQGHNVIINTYKTEE